MKIKETAQTQNYVIQLFSSVLGWRETQASRKPYVWWLKDKKEVEVRLSPEPTMHMLSHLNVK